MKKIFKLGCVAIVAGLVVGEMTARFVLGLGDPPLSVEHPTIEYLFAPSAEYRRFGNQFRTNRYHMRSDEFPQTRVRDEVRVLVLGDSVPNGGNLTDQSELATELLKNKLGEVLNSEVFVGNASAGSWAPSNLLAYVREFGVFDADVAFVVLNKGDIFDFPKFEPLNPNTHPKVKPISALGEMLARYVVPRILRLTGNTAGDQAALTAPDDARRNSMPELLKLLEIFSAENIPAFIVYHPCEDELDSAGDFVPSVGYATLKAFTDTENLPLFSFMDSYGDYVRSGVVVHRDNYHPNALGQSLMAETLFEVLEREGLLRKWKK